VPGLHSGAVGGFVKALYFHTVAAVAVFLSFGASQSLAQPQFEITLERIPGTTVAPGSTVTVEAFLKNNGGDFLIRGIQIDLLCMLPGEPGSAGTIMTTAAAPVTISNQSSTASGRVPWVFAAQGICIGGSNDGTFCRPPSEATDCTGGGTCDSGSFNGGLRPVAQLFCRFGGAPGPGEEPYTIRAGSRVYLGHIRYNVSSNAAGTFKIPYEVQTTPCENVNLTRVVGEDNMCRDANFVPGFLSVAPSCTSNAQCNNGLFCDGEELCIEASCRPGTNPCAATANPFCREEIDACVQCLHASDCPTSTCKVETDPVCSKSACDVLGSCRCDFKLDPCDEGNCCALLSEFADFQNCIGRNPDDGSGECACFDLVPDGKINQMDYGQLLPACHPDVP